MSLATHLQSVTFVDVLDLEAGMIGSDNIDVRIFKMATVNYSVILIKRSKASSFGEV